MFATRFWIGCTLKPCRLSLVIVDLSAAPYVDMHSAHVLASLAKELTTAGRRVQVVEARSAVRERLRGEEVGGHLGRIDRFTSMADVVEAFQD